MKIGSYLFLAFFDNVPLSDIIETVVLNLSSNFAKSYLKDLSQQVISLLHLGPTVVAQKRGGGQEFRPLM